MALRRGRLGRRVRDRRQPLQDVGRRRRRATHADGVADQRRVRPADDAVPGEPLREPPERDAGRRRDRRDARPGHLRRDSALLPGEPGRLGLLHGRGPRDPLLRDHPGDPDRRRPVAAAAHRPLVADLRTRARSRARPQRPTTTSSGTRASRPSRGSSSPASTGRCSSPTPTGSAPPSRTWCSQDGRRTPSSSTQTRST